MRKNRISKPSDKPRSRGKSDSLFFTKPEGFRVFKDVPASLMEHQGGLALQSMACLSAPLDALDAREREKVFAIFGQISGLRRAHHRGSQELILKLKADS